MCKNSKSLIEVLPDIEKRLKFFNLMIELMVEAINTGEELAELWREYFPGFKQWLFGPDFPYNSSKV